MDLELVSHVNGDADLLDSWFKYYRRLGISSFHLIVHGPHDENRRLDSLKDSYPVTIEDAYEGPFDSEEKKRRLNALLAKRRGRWVVLADSDEFVEFPYRNAPNTVRALKMGRKTALYAPMIQRITRDGSLETPEFIADPFQAFPLCSVDLYQRMGVEASINKYPLFFCDEGTVLQEGGNHNPPNGGVSNSLQGATHHFKFRRSVAERLDRRINSAHPWRHESVQYRDFLASHANCLPAEGAFAYSRAELFHRGLLRRPTFLQSVKIFLRQAKNSAAAPPAHKAA